MKATICIMTALLISAPVFATPTTAKAKAATAAPKNGETAPDFTLKGADGKDYKLSQFKGKNVVLEWFNNDCPYVKKHYDSKNMQKLQTATTGKGAVWLTIVSSAAGKEGHVDAAKATELKKSREMGNTAILLDSTGEVGKLYGAKTTPHMYVVDKAGKLVYQGAIDDRPSASVKSLTGAQNYIETVMNALDKNEPVPASIASTTPYGCGIKYQ